VTPNIAIVHVSNPYWHRGGIRLWLPLFLLWIPLLILAPLLLLVLFAACVALGIPFWKSIQTYWQILCGLPGTEVRVAAKANQVLVQIL
jgi:hypothetical protein